MEKWICYECGHEYQIDYAGIATHLNENGEIDHDRDEDHVPYGKELA